MNRAQMLAIFVFVALSFLHAANPSQPTQLSSQVDAEVQRLKKLGSEQKPDGQWKDLEPLLKKLLIRAETGVRTGRVYAALEDATRVRVYLEAYANSRVNGDAATMPQFEAAWKKANAELVAADQEAKQRVWTGKPLVQQALAESAQGQSLTLVEASRAYATVTDTNAGYYYIGEARADVDVASFVYSLQISARSQRFALRSWLPELQALQKKLNAEFVPPQSIDRHSDFIRINSAIKLSGDLDAAKLYAGAFYQYLTAVQLFGAMKAEPLNETKQEELRRDLAQWKEKLRASQRDTSLAQMFQERAELWIDRIDGTEVGPEQWKAAWSVVHSVLPAYEQAISAVPTLDQQTRKLVTVTLVRWPYT